MAEDRFHDVNPLATLGFRKLELAVKIEIGELPGPILEAQSQLRKQGTEELNRLVEEADQHAWCGWWDYPKRRGFDELAQIADWVRAIDVDYDCVVVVGIGGSYLGTRALAEALPAGNSKPIFYLGQHLSARSIQRSLDELSDRRPFVVVVSKTGTTTEPAICFRIVRNYLEARFGNEVARRIAVVTDAEQGALRAAASRIGFAAFEVPDNCGGRYSVLTPVGVVPLMLGGYPIEAVMAGADDMFASLGNADENHASVQYACARQACYRSGKSTEVLSYNEPQLVFFVEWWKQLFGESEGKDGKGIFPVGMMFTTDLHSLGQLMQDGERNVFETFLQFERDECELSIPDVDAEDGLDYLIGKQVSYVNDVAMNATREAHREGGVPCLQLRPDCLDAKSMGELVAFFEVACAISARIQGVDPFTQPGVDAYKQNMFRMLGKR